uniref:Uncharacterized protein n=1 Tax=Leersia perrieri TaxID=77586 RepID=A0A0D9WPK2_9ORYZ
MTRARIGEHHSTTERADFPLDFIEWKFLNHATASFGQLTYWLEGDQMKGRVLIRAKYKDHDFAPRKFDHPMGQVLELVLVQPQFIPMAGLNVMVENLSNAKNLASSILLDGSSLLNHLLPALNTFTNMVLPKKTVFDCPPPLAPLLDWVFDQFKSVSSPLPSDLEILEVEPLDVQPPSLVTSAPVPLLLPKAPVKKRDGKTVLYCPYRRQSSWLQHNKHDLDLQVDPRMGIGNQGEGLQKSSKNLQKSDFIGSSFDDVNYDSSSSDCFVSLLQKMGVDMCGLSIDDVAEFNLGVCRRRKIPRPSMDDQ